MHPQNPVNLIFRPRLWVYRLCASRSLLPYLLIGLLVLAWTKPILAESHNAVALVSLSQSAIGESPSVESAAEQLEPLANERSQASILVRINQRGNVMVAGLPYDFPPYSYLDESGQLVGFDVELLEAVAATWGVRVEFVPALAADAVALLAGGAVDVTPVSWPALDSQKLLRAPAHIDFSQPYLIDNLCLAALRARESADGNSADGNTSNANSILGAGARDASRQVGFISGLGQEESLTQWLTEWGTASDIDNTILAPFRENGPILASLQSGGIRSYLTFEGHCHFLADSFVDENNDTGGQIVNQLVAEVEQFPATKQESTIVRFVWGIADNTPQSRNLINYTLQELVRSGEYETIHNRWFPQQSTPRIAVYPGTWTETFASLIRSDLISRTMGSTNVDEPLESVEPMVAPAVSALDSWKRGLISAGQTLRVGVPYDLPLFGQQGASIDSTARSAPNAANPNLTGLDVDLALAIYQHLFPNPSDANPTLNQSNIELIPIARGAGSRLLVQGELDLMIAAYAPQWPALTELGIGESYLRDQAGLLVSETKNVDGQNDGSEGQNVENIPSSPASSDFPDLDALGTITYVVDDLGAELWLDAYAPIAANTIPFQEFSAALRALDAGQVDGLAGGAALLRYVADQHDDLSVVYPLNDSIYFSVATGPHNTTLRRAVDSALVEMAADGTLAVLHEKWIGHHVALVDEPTVTIENSSTSPEGILSESFPLFSATPAAASDSEDDVAEIKRLLVRDLVQSLISANEDGDSSAPVGTTPEPNTERSLQPTPTPNSVLTSTSEPASTLEPTAEPTSAVVDSQEVQADVQTESDVDTYIVGEGETLITLAVQFYGDQSKWLLIYEANRALIGDNPNYVAPGSALIIPAE